MATGKRYYWIKLKDSFMTSDSVDFLMSQKDGANYVVLYQMLCLKTINTGGVLSRQLGEIIIPYDEEKIARDCKWFSIDTVRIAINLYKALGLIYVNEDGNLALYGYKNLVGSETDWASQKRVQRSSEQTGQLFLDGCGQCPQDVPKNVHTDIDIDIEIEKDKDVILSDPAIAGKKRQSFSPPTADEVAAYCAEKGYGIDAEYFVLYYEARGWMLGKQKMKSWKSAVAMWNKRDEERNAEKSVPEKSQNKNARYDENGDLKVSY